MKKKMFSILIYIATISWMVFIFILSGQNGVGSSGLSMKIVKFLREILYPNFSELSLNQQENITNNMVIVIRKGAHMSEFAILCLLMFSSIRTVSKKNEPYIIAPVFCFLYALSDEFHQGFVSGRNMAFTDVLIDTLGALIMLGVIYLFRIIYLKKNKEKVNV